MKIVVIGGTGLIGSKVITLLRERGHDARAASPSSGVDLMTGAGLSEALADAQVVVDVSNSPSFEPAAVLNFFQTAGRHLQAAEIAAGVQHHVALSIVGVERTPENGYFRAKVAQEALIEASPVPWTIVRATQFIEFIGAIAEAAGPGPVPRVSTTDFQPIAADDVAAAVAEAALAAPARARIDIAGPERMPMVEAVQRWLTATGDARRAEPDPTATYFGALPGPQSLVPLGAARLGRITLDAWLAGRARRTA